MEVVNTEEALRSARHKSVAAQRPYMMRNQDSEMAKFWALGLVWCKSFWGVVLWPGTAVGWEYPGVREWHWDYCDMSHLVHCVWTTYYNKFSLLKVVIKVKIISNSGLTMPNWKPNLHPLPINATINHSQPFKNLALCHIIPYAQPFQPLFVTLLPHRLAIISASLHQLHLVLDWWVVCV